MKDKEKTNRELLRLKAEEQLNLHAPQSGDLLQTEADPLKLIHELQVYQIELEMQNEELTMAKQKSEENFRQLAESSTLIVYRLLFKPKLKFDYISPSVTAITGYTPEDHYNDPQLGFKLVHPDDRILLENTTRYSKGEPLELRWIRKDGQVIWTEQRNVLVFDENNEPYAIEGNASDISDRKNMELGLRKEVERNSLLLGLFAKAPALTDKELFDQALDIAVQITESKIGFFHQISDNQKEIILTTWNDEAKKNCTTVFDNHYPLMKAGNWADCIRQKKAVIYNDYPVSTNKKGLPEGHAPVGRIMSIPVVNEEKVRLIFGVGNKSTDYTDSDVIQIQAVANELHKILEKRKVEKTLQQSEDRWQFAIEGSNDGIWDWNLLTDEVFFSNRWKEMIGYGSDELEGRLIEWKNRVHPDNIENVLLKLQEHFEKKTAVYSDEHRMLCKDGSWKWILDRGKVLEWNDEGKPTRMVGTHTDITDSKNAEEVVQKSEEKFRIVADNAYNWEFWEGSDGRFIHHSPSCIKLTGYSADEFLNDNDLMLKIIHPDDRQHFIDHHRESLAHHAQGKHFFRIINKEGEIREIEHVCQPVFNDVNTYMGIRGTNIDITERKLAENQLKESEVQFRNLTNAGSALLWTAGKDKLCNYFNEIWLRFTGRTLEQEMGNGWTEGVHPEDYDRCLETYVTAFDKHESFEMEYRLRHSSGQYKWIVDLGTPNFNSQGEFVGYIGHCFDISERKRIDLELGITLSKYKTFFDVLPIGVTVTDNEGNLLEGNLMSEKLLGLSNEEVILRRMDGTEWKIVRPDGTPMPPDEFASVRALKENRKVENVEMGIVKGLHATTWISVSASQIPIDGQGVVITYSDITQRKLVEDTQSFLLGCGLPGNSEDFFESLARYLSQTLNMEYVCIDRLEGDGLTAQTVAIYNEGHFESNVQYALKDTPCGEVVDRSLCLYRHGVRHLFPGDEALQDLNAESYVGTTLLDSKGRAIGLIAIIGHQPMHDESKAEELLKLVAPRAAGELERREAENALKETLEQLNQTNLLLEKRVEERTQELRQLSNLQQAILRHAGLAVISTSAEGLIEQFNYAAEEMLGYKAEELVGLYTPILFHDQQELARFSNMLTLETGEIVPSDFRLFQHILQKALNRTNEWTYVRKEGDKVPVNLTVSSVKDSEGELLGYIGIAMDITKEKLAIKALRESEERFHNMFWDHSAIMILVDPETGEILEANKAAEQFYGYAFNNGPKLLISDLNTSSPDQVKEEMKNAVRDHRNYFVFTHKLVAGDVRTVEVHSTPIEVSENTVLFSIIHDITERRLAEEALKKSEAENRAIIQAVPDLMFRINRDGTYLDSHSQHESSLYLPKEHFVGRKVREVLPPDLARQSMQSIGEAFTTGEVVQYEYSLAVQGKDLYFENRVIAISDEEALSIIRDITDRKGMLTALKMQSAAFESFALTIIITDIDGRIQWANSAFSHLTGYSVEEAIGKTPGEMVSSGKQDKDFYSTFWETILTKKVWKGELINRRKDGTLYYEEETITPVLDARGNISSFIAIKIDITERKKLYQELADEKRRLADIIKGTNAGTWEWNVQTGETTFNESWAGMLGYTLDEISPVSIETWMKFSHPDDLKSSGELLEKHFKGELDYYSFESRMKHKKGEWIWVLDRGKVHEWDSEGKPLMMSGTHQDITDGKNAEAEMLWNKSFLELMSNSSPLGFFVVDNRTDNILYFNHRFCEIWGIRHIEDQMHRGELKNNDIIPHCLPVLADVPAFAESCKPLQSETNQIVLEDEIAFTENRTVRRFTTQIRGDNDEYFGRFYIFEDITERKRAEDFENELLELSPKLTGLTLSEINSAIDLAIFRIGRFLSADRSYIFEINAEEATMSNTHEWCNEGIHPEIDNLQGIPYNLLPNWIDRLNKNENVIIASVKDLPESWKSERDILEPQGIQSLIAIPLLTDDTLIGFVGLDSVVNMKEYNSGEIKILKVWSSMLASLIKDRRSATLLEQTRQNYETFFNTIDDFLWVLDQQGNIIHTNNTVENRLEYTTEELLNQSVLMVHPAERREETGRIVGEMLAGTSEFCPVPIVTKSGNQIPVETRVKAGFWNGVPVIFGVSKDISQIQLSEQKFSSAFHSSSSIMTITRFSDDQFVDVNTAFVDTLGYSREDIEGQTLVTLGVVRKNPEGVTVQELINGGIPMRELEVNVYSKSNELLVFLMSVEDIHIGSERCILSVAVNITERKTMENELRKARKEADQANMAKSEFLSRMSHELRTPMNSILGFAQLLEMGELKTGQKKGVTHILTSGKHLLKLIDEVLDISRIEAGKLILSHEKVQVGRIIHEMLDSIQQLIASRHIKIELNISSGDEQPINADRQRLRQVLLNLLTNAVKYNKEGGTITISTSFLPQSDEGDACVRISIKDTGIGISEEGLAKIFTPFERIGAEKNQIEGTGLGLSVVNKLMDAMGGNLGVESTPGVGSTFWIELPLAGNKKNRKQLKVENLKLTADLDVANAEIGFQIEEKIKRADELKVANIELAFQNEEKGKRADELKVAKAEIDLLTDQNRKQANELLDSNKEISFRKVSSSPPTTAQSAKTGTILYIEDNESNIELIRQILDNQRLDIRLLSNFTGKETVRLAIDCAADLILLDLDLPDLHGSEVLERLKADEFTKDIPVVIISADAMPHQLEKLMQAGAKDYITKPVDISAFLKVVDEWIGKKKV